MPNPASFLRSSSVPTRQVVQLLGLLRITEQDRSPLEGQFHPPQANVIRPAFDQYRRELHGQYGFQERDVARKDLLLQRDRVRRDNDSTPLVFFRGGTERDRVRSPIIIVIVISASRRRFLGSF